MTERVATPYLHLAPRPTPGVDITQYTLSPQDAFVWSRMDGKTSLTQLADGAGMAAGVCLEVLERLSGLGLVSWPEDALPQRAALEAAAQMGVAAQEEDALREPGDLSEAERRNILKLEKSLTHLNHWELLGVGPQTSEGGLKKAYHHVSKLYHPDRHFGKNLGSFRDRLERIFDAMHKAYHVLSEPGAAHAYRESHPPRSQASLAQANPNPTGSSASELEEHRQSIVAQRREKERQRQGLPAEVSPAKVQALMAQADLELAAGRHVQAGRSYAAVADLLPAALEHAVQASHAYALGREHFQARVYMERALALGPQRRDLILMAADMAEQANNIGEALRLLGTAASLDDKDPHVKYWIGRLSRK